MAGQRPPLSGWRLPWLQIDLRKVIAACVIALPAGGCFLPKSGPSFREMLKPVPTAQRATTIPYRIVDVNAETLPQLMDYVPDLPGAFVERQAPKELRLGKGDVITITIFEAASGGLFIPAQASVRPGNFVELPRQTINKEGDVAVPYAGNVRAEGLTIPELQKVIENKLRPRAIEPQVVVTVQEKRSSEVSVLGTVNAPTRFALSDAGDRVLDAIARAGGPRNEGFETYVTLQRNQQSITVSFDQLVKMPANNIFLKPGDTVYVHRHQRSFNVVGATGTPGRYVFDTAHISVADAVARAGGLEDKRANPAAVFLYRIEGNEAIQSPKTDVQPNVPTIYRFDMRSAAGFFYASKVPVRNQDFIYIANASSVELNKFLEVVNLVALAGYNFSQAVRTP